MSDEHGITKWGPGLSSFGSWAVGEWTYFQVWYRDPMRPPRCETFNLTEALGVLFKP